MEATRYRGRLVARFLALACLSFVALPFTAPHAEEARGAGVSAAPISALTERGAAVSVVSATVSAATVSPGAVSPATLAELRGRYNQVLHAGLHGLRSPEAPGQRIVGDNTDPWGMTWTKCTNLGIDLMATLVAEARGLLDAARAREDVREIVGILSKLDKHRGIFPENIKIRGGVLREVVAGRSRFSSLDSAWVTLALSLVQSRYDAAGDVLGGEAGALIAGQDYRSFVRDDGTLGAGYYVDVATDRKVEDIAFSYRDRNSEARPLVLALVGLGQLPESAWDKTSYGWDQREGLTLAKGWHYSAFVEMTGALFFDEAQIAPRSLGKSHENYIAASSRVAQRKGHRLWGYAPACDAVNAYMEFGLDRPDAVTPYAAALLTLTGNASAVQNLAQILSLFPGNSRALPDGLDPHTGAVSCGVARLLDQGLLFLALNADVVRQLAQRTEWYPSARRRLAAMDEVMVGADSPR
jgi:hypothetical protein